MNGTVRTSINISKQQFPSGLSTQNASCKVTIQSDKSHRQTDGEKSDIYSSYRFLLYYLSKTVHSPSVPLRYLRLKANLKEKKINEKTFGASDENVTNINFIVKRCSLRFS